MFIFSNLATSLDGKIAAADRGHFWLGTPADRKQMQVLRRRCDAIVVGASTLRSFRRPMIVVGGKKQPVNAIISSELEGVSPSWPFFQRADVRRVLFVNRTTPPARLKRFAKVAEIVVLDLRKSVARQVAHALAERGVKRLLVEGGGGVMWDFAAEDLLDELHVTLTPWILGGGRAPTLVDGEGFPSGKGLKLRLVKAKRLRDEIYLTYRRVR